MIRWLAVIALCLAPIAAAEPVMDEEMVQLPFGQLRKLLQTNENFYGTARDALDEVLRLRKEVEFLRAKLACV